MKEQLQFIIFSGCGGEMAGLQYKFPEMGAGGRVVVHKAALTTEANFGNYENG